MNKEQQAFLEQLALRIPRLFEAIAQGNVKSEYIVGVRRIGTRHVRLKLVAEVVDPGANPLATHGQMRTVSETLKADKRCTPEATASSSPASRRRRPRKR